MQKSKLRFLCFIIILVLFSAAIFIFFAVNTFNPIGFCLTQWGNEPFGNALPNTKDAKIIGYDEYNGISHAQALWLQLTDEQAAVFEKDNVVINFWRPLPLPPDVEEFLQGFYLGQIDEQAKAYFSTRTNGCWALYNYTDAMHVFDADSLNNTCLFTVSVYDADSKQLLIYEGRFY
ncbi:MAG: hypothetical protein RR351_02595 [Christensenella sp.]